MPALRFDGNEPIGKVIDSLKAASSSLFNKDVVVTTTNGTHTGRLADKGSVWLVLESKSGRKPVGASGEIVTKTLIAASSIIAISFEIVE